MGLELDETGFHHSLLSRFRDRLIADKQASYAFDRVLDYLSTIGLVRRGSKQRIDSTHVVGMVRELSRIELLHETLRLFCKDAEKFRSSMDGGLEAFFEQYSEDISLHRLSAKEKSRMTTDSGLAMRSFIAWAENCDSAKELRTTKSFTTLKTVFSQNFEDDGPDDDQPELIKVATGKDHICSPHDPEARYANKGGKGWLGYKAQIAETIVDSETDNAPNFITFADVNEATDHDGRVVEEYCKDQEEKGIAPSEVYADTHYNTEANIENLK